MKITKINATNNIENLLFKVFNEDIQRGGVNIYKASEDSYQKVIVSEEHKKERDKFNPWQDKDLITEYLEVENDTKNKSR